MRGSMKSRVRCRWPPVNGQNATDLRGTRMIHQFEKHSNMERQILQLARLALALNMFTSVRTSVCSALRLTGLRKEQSSLLQCADAAR